MLASLTRNTITHKVLCIILTYHLTPHWVICTVYYPHHIKPYTTTTIYLHIQLPPPQTTTTQCKLPECKCSNCAIGWIKKHYQRKLQLVTTTTCPSGMLHQLKVWKHHKHKVQRSGCKVQRSGHKVQRSGPASALVDTGAAATCNYNHHHQQPDSTMQQSICVRAGFVEEMVSPHTLLHCVVLVLSGHWLLWL